MSGGASPHDLFEERPDGMVLRLHVQPAAGRTGVTGRHGDALKVKVAAPPQAGRANEACLDLVAELAGVSRSEVTLVGGDASRSKRIRISGTDADRLVAGLELALAEASGEARGRGSVPRSSEAR